MNGKKTAVDCAVRFAFANADSLTLSMGSNGRFASFEDFVFTLMSVYDTIPSELNAGAMCRASIYNKYIDYYREFAMEDLKQNLIYFNTMFIVLLIYRKLNNKKISN